MIFQDNKPCLKGCPKGGLFVCLKFSGGKNSVGEVEEWVAEKKININKINFLTFIVALNCLIFHVGENGGN